MTSPLIIRSPVHARRRVLTLAVSAALFASSGTVLAQQQSAAGTAPLADTPVQAADATELDTLVVTGSRIRRDPDFDGPAPVSTISAEDIRASGHTQISDVVNQLPGFAVTQTAQTSNQSGTPGVNALDLRGMGVQRTLTLVDGRRQVPSIPGTSGVDLSMIPSSLVERVEVVTGGASALYGADAVNGVANFILKKDFDGLDASVRYGDSTRGDMPSTTVDVLWGTNFADYRGNVTVYGFWEKQSGTVSGSDRPWTRDGWPVYGRTGPDAKYELYDHQRNLYDSQDANVVLGQCEPGNQVACLYTFSADGQLRRPQLGPGGITNASGPDNLLQQGLTDGGEYGGRYDAWLLSVPSDRKSVRSSLNFSFSDAARLFANIGYSESNSTTGSRALASYGTLGVSGDSPFITPEMIEANGGPIDYLEFARHFDEVGRWTSEYRRDLVQGVVGLEGDFGFLGRGWNYSGYYSWGRSQQDSRDTNAASVDRLMLGLDAVTDANGNPVCRDAVAVAAGCVAVNPFARLTPEMIDWVRYSTGSAHTTQTQRVASAYVGGGLFDMDGGEAQLVVGGEYRKERSDMGVSPEYDTRNPAYDPTLGWTGTPVVGEYSVKEAFAELALPLLGDRPFAERLSLDLAGRISDYSTAGRTTTSKIGLEWQPIDDLTLRGTWGKAVRAPNIGELYTAGVVASAWMYDPCNETALELRSSQTEYTAINCAILDPSNSQPANYWQWLDYEQSGNLDLEPETAKTTTFGFVLRPRFIPNLTVSADYYRIDLRGVIAMLGFQNILNRCVDQASLDNAFCDLVTRDADNNLQSVAVQQLNLSQSVARGVDINASWRQDLGEWFGGNAGTLSVDLNYGRTLERRDISDPENPDDAWDYVELFGTPKWKGNLRTGWSNETFNVSWNLRHVSRQRSSSGVTEARYVKPWAGSVVYSDAYASWQVTPVVSVFGGLNNVFDRAPPRIPGAEAGGAGFNQTGYQSGLYDVIGRTWYTGVRVSL